MITAEASKIRKAWDGIAVNFDRYVTPAANWVLAKTALRHQSISTLEKI